MSVRAPVYSMCVCVCTFVTGKEQEGNKKISQGTNIVGGKKENQIPVRAHKTGDAQAL